MNDICIGKYDRAGGSFGCNYAIHFDCTCNSAIVQCANWVGGGGVIHIVLYGFTPMLTRHKHQWSIELVDLIHKDQHVDQSISWHTVVNKIG